MDKRTRKLIISQLDDKIAAFKPASAIVRPQQGWLKVIRTSLNITLEQLGNRLNTSPQTVRGREQREGNGNLTLKALEETANAMEMQLVYALVPKNGSLEKLIETRAQQKALQIIQRTSASMRLEDQENSTERLQKAIAEKAAELKQEMPRYLWE